MSVHYTSWIRIRIPFNSSLLVLVAEIFTLYKINSACLCVCLCVLVHTSCYFRLCISLSLLFLMLRRDIGFWIFSFHQLFCSVRPGLVWFGLVCQSPFYFIVFIFYSIPFHSFALYVYIGFSILFNIIVISMLLFLSGIIFSLF